MVFSSYRGIVGHITTMLDYAQIHIFDACGHYKGRLLLILILHNVMHDITSTLPVDVAPSARFTQNGRPMSIAGGRQEWFGYYWLWFSVRSTIYHLCCFWNCQSNSNLIICCCFNSTCCLVCFVECRSIIITMPPPTSTHGAVHMSVLHHHL